MSTQRPEDLQVMVVPQSPTVIEISPTASTQANPLEIIKQNPGDLAEARKRGYAIVLTDPRAMAEIGTASAESLTTTASTILDGIRLNKAGAVGDLLITLASSTRELNPRELAEQKGGQKLRNLLVKAGITKDIVTQFLKRYDTVSERIGEIQRDLVFQKDALLTDAQRMIELTQECEVLSYQLLLDAAGIDLRLAYEKRQLQGLNLLAERGQPYDHAKRDLLTTVIPILEQKQADLLVQAFAAKLTAEQAKIQMKSNTELAVKVGSALTLTMSVWRTQIAVFVAALRSQEAAKGTAAIREVTGEIITSTAEAIHTGAVAAAREANSPLVTAEKLIEAVSTYQQTVDDVIAEYQKGKVLRDQSANAIDSQIKRLEASKASAAAQISTIAAGNAPQITSPR